MASTPALAGDGLEPYRDLARQFSRSALRPLFAPGHPDGDLSRLPEELEAAFQLGIASSPDRTMPGSEHGIWGSATDQLGLEPSLVLLSTLAETCGGIAMCLHAQGVASHLALRAAEPLPFAPVKVSLCLQEGLAPPGLATILAPDRDAPARVATVALKRGDDYVLEGVKSFAYSMAQPDGYVVLARTGATWGCFLVPRGAAGLEAADVGARTGLRACRVEHVAFERVAVPGRARLDPGDARRLVVRALCLQWAGMSAVAVGVARGAVAAARRYAAERRQGGCAIEEHLAVQALLADADAASQAADAVHASLAGLDLASLAGLGKAAAAKLAVTELCARSVTQSLQVFGGYGYVEDYGMEKRLRDVAVLRSASGSPTYLRRLVFELGKEGAA